MPHAAPQVKRPKLKPRIDLPKLKASVPLSQRKQKVIKVKPEDIEKEDKPRPMLIPRLSPEAEELIRLSARVSPVEHIPTELSRYQVCQLASINLSHVEIAGVLGITKETMYKYYRNELDHGKAACTANVALRLYKVATEADGAEAVKAMMFWLRARAGWKDTSQVEMSGPNGQPIELAQLSLTNEERATRVFQLMQSGRAAGDRQTT
jgi:hypothetical protein